ncbi:hypothetical protein O5541_05565 [Escherichia coli]|nr:hypothetical protein [Escherichia coli]
MAATTFAPTLATLSSPPNFGGWKFASRIIAAFCRRDPDKHPGSWLLICSGRAFCSRGESLLTRDSRRTSLYVSENQLKSSANNPEREEAEDPATLPIAVLRDGNRLQRQLCAGCSERAEMRKRPRMMLTDSVFQRAD